MKHSRDKLLFSLFIHVLSESPGYFFFDMELFDVSAALTSLQERPGLEREIIKSNSDELWLLFRPRKLQFKGDIAIKIISEVDESLSESSKK